ncbi:hypothetical protein ACKUB1_01800 [Methanospirillum stamsii]|nr:hypothetical protein [Methanospirillum stamsii]
MMTRKKISKILSIFVVLLMVLPAVISADEENSTITHNDDSQPSDELKGGLLYNGTINPEGYVNIKSDSGNDYKIQGNTPVGVLESLHKSGAVSNYVLGDELMDKKGILLIDEIDSLKSGNESGWFVKVNGQRLEDVVLSDVMGLNRFALKEGDVVLYVLGNPEGLISESVAYLTVTIGKTEEPLPDTTEIKAEGESAQNTKNLSQESTLPDEIEIKEDESDNISRSNFSSDNGNEETDNVDRISSGGQEVIYKENISLPSGTINISTTGGEYDINTATPLGILQKLLDDDMISDLSISDKSMQKGGILFLEGINGYHFSGDKTWFVVVNGVVLKDYLDPEIDGLNLFKVSSGDEIGYYFGEPSKPVDEAVASLLITIE